MQLLHLLTLASVFAGSQACTGCPHPGTFVGFLSLYTSPNPNFCGTTVSGTTIAISIPSKYYNPPDESPCDGTVNVTNTCTGKTISALVVGSCSTCANNDIQLTTSGLAALAPDANPNHAPGTVVWTFD